MNKILTILDLVPNCSCKLGGCASPHGWSSVFLHFSFGKVMRRCGFLRRWPRRSTAGGASWADDCRLTKASSDVSSFVCWKYNVVVWVNNCDADFP